MGVCELIKAQHVKRSQIEFGIACLPVQACCVCVAELGFPRPSGVIPASVPLRRSLLSFQNNETHQVPGSRRRSVSAKHTQTRLGTKFRQTVC